MADDTGRIAKLDIAHKIHRKADRNYLLTDGSAGNA